MCNSLDDQISGMLTIFLVCWPYFWYIDHISGMLTLSLVLVLVFHSKGSTVNWSLIGSDMPSALGMVAVTKFILKKKKLILQLDFY